MNSRPSTPLCQNCLMTELYCAAVRYESEDERCCSVCEHRDSLIPAAHQDAT